MRHLLHVKFHILCFRKNKRTHVHDTPKNKFFCMHQIYHSCVHINNLSIVLIVDEEDHVTISIILHLIRPKQGQLNCLVQMHFVQLPLWISVCVVGCTDVYMCAWADREYTLSLSLPPSLSLSFSILQCLKHLLQKHYFII